MTSHTPDMQAVLDRVEALENQNRRLRWCWLVTFGLPIALLLLWGANLYHGPQPVSRGTVEAERFLLKDSKGSLRATLGTVANGVELQMLGENGRPEVLLGVGGAGIGPMLEFSDLKGAGVKITNVVGQPRLTLWGTGKVAATIFVTRNSARLGLQNLDRELDGPGFQATFLEAEHGSSASLALYGKDGKLTWGAP